MRSESQVSTIRFRFGLTVLTVILMTVSIGASVGEEVVATVGDRAISSQAIESAVQGRIDQQYFHRNVSEQQLVTLRNEELDNLVRRELRALRGLDAGLELPIEEALTVASQIEQQLGADRYRRSMEHLGWDRTRHVHEIARTLLAERAWNEMVLQDVAVSDEEAFDEWKEDQERWSTPKQIHLRHILLRVPPQADETVLSERMELGEAIVARVAAGEDFSVIATESSEDDYRIRGGDLGWIHEGRLLPEVEIVAWEAEIGTVHGPIRSVEGFHIIEVLGRREARKMSRDEALPMIRKLLEKQRLEEVGRRFYERASADHPVTILDEELSWSP